MDESDSKKKPIESEKEEKIPSGILSHTLRDPTWNPVESTVIHRMDCRHVEAIRKIADGVFERTWSDKDFAYFLAHSCGHSFGLFQRSFDNRKEVLKAFFISLVVRGDMDIVSIATRVDSRRKGFAENLLSYARSQANVRRAFLEVDKKNREAVKLYGKMGFEIVGERKGYYNQNRDAFVMRWVAKAPNTKIN